MSKVNYFFEYQYIQRKKTWNKYFVIIQYSTQLNIEYLPTVMLLNSYISHSLFSEEMCAPSKWLIQIENIWDSSEAGKLRIALCFGAIIYKFECPILPIDFQESKCWG